MPTLYGIYAVSILLLIFILIYWSERSRHKKRLRTIPLRIWVNGSRGKSSVTRLIAAGLRANGMQVIAKTTGTLPRLVVDNHTEEPIIRLGMANIREQIKIVARAKKFEAQAIVFECMALRPDLQRIEAHHIVQPTIVVVTNVRPDHLDVMGPSLKDIRKAFLDAMPARCILFTTDTILAQQSKTKDGIESILVNANSLDPMTEETLARFSHIEHEENIALALSVCQQCGIEANDALQSMTLSQPDPGALRCHAMIVDGKRVDLVNAMAANDPESTRIIWNKVDKGSYQHIHILINCRKDRIDRSLTFIETIRELGRDATSLILTGEATSVLYKRLKKHVTPDKILDLGNKGLEQASRIIISQAKNSSMIFAIGNTVGYGMDLINKIVEKGGSAC